MQSSTCCVGPGLTSLLQCFQHHPADTERSGEAGSDERLAAWIINYLSDRTQYLRTNGCVSDVVACSKGALKGMVLSLFLFTLCTVEIKNILYPFKKFLDDLAFVGCILKGVMQEYRRHL